MTDVDRSIPVLATNADQRSTAERVNAILRRENMRQPIDVRLYGAKGDGVSDDTAALQAALDTAQPVLVPPGTYRVTSALQMRDAGSLQGLGWASILLIDGDQRGLVAANDCLIANLQVKGNGAAVSPVEGRGGIQIEGVADVTVSNVLVQDTRSTGISGGQSSRVVLTNFIVKNTYEHGVYFARGSDFSITNGVIIDAGQNGGSAGTGFKLAACTDVAASNIVIRNPKTYGVIVEGYDDGISSRVTLSNLDAESNGASVSGLRIVNYIDECTVCGGRFSGDYGLTVFSDGVAVPSNIRITGANIAGAANGLRIYYGDEIFIAGCAISASDGGAYAGVLDATSGAVYIVGCLLDAPSGLNLAGTASYATGNHNTGAADLPLATGFVGSTYGGVLQVQGGFIWVDVDGKARVDASRPSDPTTNASGTIIGTQT